MVVTILPIKCLRFAALATLLTSALCSVGSTSVAQPPLLNPLLQVHGKPNQTVIYSVRYFDDDQATETVHGRVTLADTGTLPQPLELEFGHSGVQIQLVVATSHPTTVQLLDGDSVVSEQTRHQSGPFELRFGSLPNTDDLQSPRALLNEAEQSLLTNFISAIPSAQTEALVSSLPLANIDWQTLSAYFTTLTRELGQPIQQMETNPLDGWIGWDGSLGARVLSGPIAFERGVCQFNLMAIDGKLVDVEPFAPKMPADWFDETPRSLDAYAEQAHALAQALLAGDAISAQLFFAPRYHEEVSVEDLTEVGRELAQLTGGEVPTCQLEWTEFTRVPASATDKRLTLFSSLSFESGQRCISRVDFIIPSGPDIIGRAQLAAIHVHEAWQSASPQDARQLTELLADIGLADPQRAASNWLEHLHPDLLPHITRSKLATFLEQVASRAGKQLTAPNFDQWTASRGSQSTAYGPSAFSREPNLVVHSHWMEGRLLGVSFFGDSFAASTLDLVPQYEPTRQHGADFWEQLLSHQTSAAHAKLAESFRQRLPLDKLSELFPPNEGEPQPRLSRIFSEHLRLTNRDDRSLPIMFTAYYLAEFEDGTYLPLSCEFSIDPANPVSHQLLNFSTDVAASYPVAPSQTTQDFWEAFVGADAAKVVKLVPPTTRERIDPSILEAFLTELKSLIGHEPLPISSRLMQQYVGGRQRLQLRSILSTPEDPVEVEASFERGQLQNFQFTHPQLAAFADKLQDLSGLDAHAQAFASEWLSVATLRNSSNERLFGFLATNLKTQAAINKLQELSRQLNLEVGGLLECELIDHVYSDETNEIELVLRLRFERGQRDAHLTYMLNVFMGLISGVDLSAGGP